MINSLMERKGGLRRLNKDSELFAEFMESAKLVDIPEKMGSTPGTTEEEEKIGLPLALIVF